MIIPINSYILAKAVEEPKKGALILRESPFPLVYDVIAIAPDLESSTIGIGSRIMIEKYMAIDIDYDGSQCSLIAFKHVLGVFS